MADELTLSEAERRTLAPWVADCAERVLATFEVQAPGDARPREAIDGLRAFADGRVSVERMTVLAAAAHSAARETREPRAVAAARAAGHAAAVAHTGSHARGVIYAAKASTDPDAELDWQVEHASDEVKAILNRLPMPRDEARTLIGRLAARLG